MVGILLSVSLAWGAMAAEQSPPVGASIAAGIPTLPQADDDYKLGPGDKVHITVVGEADISKDYEVDGTGLVSFPFIGQIRAAGLSSRAFETALKTKLDDGYFRDARVNVEIANYRPYYIFGEVKNPQAYPFVSGMTVINAIVLAGGYSDRAYKNRIFIRRFGSDKELPATESTKLMPGDILRVPERFF